MTSQPTRDPVADQLLTPENAALIIIDFQPVQIGSVAAMDRRVLVHNIVAVARAAKLYGLPVVLSTVNARINQPLIQQLQEVFPEIEPLDRTAINSWEDVEFVKAVKATGRKKLMMTAIWTEACLTFPALDALREGYEVYPVVDACGGASPEGHHAALQRLIQAGAKPTSWVQLICELQRDWQRKQTVPEFENILFSVGSR
jgi:nicotinamidase-related amidase